MSYKTTFQDNKELSSWEAQSYHTPFGVKRMYWDTEDQDVNVFSDNIIMPRYSHEQIPYVETPHYETYKKESLEGMIKNWQNLNVRLKAEKSADIPNIKKIKTIESKLDILQDAFLRDSDFISRNIKQISLIEILNSRVK